MIGQLVCSRDTGEVYEVIESSVNYYLARPANHLGGPLMAVLKHACFEVGAAPLRDVTAELTGDGVRLHHEGRIIAWFDSRYRIRNDDGQLRVDLLDTRRNA